MTAKEQMVDIIIAQGYDMLTACELADKAIEEFKQSGKQRETYTIGNVLFTLTYKEGYKPAK